MYPLAETADALIVLASAARRRDHDESVAAASHLALMHPSLHHLFRWATPVKRFVPTTETERIRIAAHLALVVIDRLRRPLHPDGSPYDPSWIKVLVADVLAMLPPRRHGGDQGGSGSPAATVPPVPDDDQGAAARPGHPPRRDGYSPTLGAGPN